MPKCKGLLRVDGLLKSTPFCYHASQMNDLSCEDAALETPMVKSFRQTKNLSQ